MSKNLSGSSFSKIKFSSMISKTDDISEYVSNISADLSDEIKNLESRIGNALKIIDDKYTTKIEVFASNEDLPPGTISDISVDFNLMFNGTNVWENNKIYDPDQVVTYENNIYKALTDISGDVQLSDSTKWENITSMYMGEKNGTMYHKYINGIKAQTVQILEFRTSNNKEQQNIVIDWGDGTTTKLSEANDTKSHNEISSVLGSVASCDTIIDYTPDPTDYESSIFCWHDYSKHMTDNGLNQNKYTITIVGTTCWGLKCDFACKHGTNREEKTTATAKNMISRIWDLDLPWAENIINPSSFTKGSDRLIKINVPAYFPAIFQFKNISNTFVNCKNLQYVRGFSKYTWYNTVRSIQNIFQNCESLLNLDINLPHSVSVYEKSFMNMFKGCTKLCIDISKIFPITGFSTSIITLHERMFSNCKSLMCSDETKLGDILWNDTSKRWKGISEVFSTCNSTLKKIIPSSWGGTKEG